MSDDSSALRIQLLIGFMCAALVGYFVLLGRQGVLLVASGKPVAAGLGIAVLLLPIVGLWAMIATLRAGFTHQRLARVHSLALTGPMCRSSRIDVGGSRLTVGQL